MKTLHLLVDALAPAGGLHLGALAFFGALGGEVALAWRQPEVEISQGHTRVNMLTLA